MLAELSDLLKNVKVDEGLWKNLENPKDVFPTVSDIICNVNCVLNCLNSSTCLGNLKNDCSNIKEEFLSYSGPECNCTQLLNPLITSLIATTLCYDVGKVKTALVCYVDITLQSSLTNFDLLTNCEALKKNVHGKLVVNGPNESKFCKTIDDTLRSHYIEENSTANCKCHLLD